MGDRADVVVIGAGPSGFVASERLRARGLDVVVLDAGPRLRKGATLAEVDRRAWAYRAEGGSFDWYRVRAVGGRGLLWGGWSYRFPPRVLGRAGFANACALGTAYEEIEQALGIVEGTVDERYARAGRELEVRVVPKRAPLRRDGDVWRPFRARGSPPVRTHAIALRFEHRHGVANALAYFDAKTGKTRVIEARAFVLAASPIESARILLESELPDANIGRGFVDHLVASYLLIEPRPPSRGAGRFPGSALVESFVNVDERSARDYRGGFSIELTGPVKLETFGVERMVPDADAWSATQIHALGESHPDPARWISIDRTRRDAFDRPIPVVHVGTSAEDQLLAADMKRACVAFADAIATPGSRLVAFLDPLQAGAGHEAGTCAMGSDEGSPCDRTGRVRALANVWVADASVMRTAGDRHPTLTILAHARCVADAVTAAI